MLTPSNFIKYVSVTIARFILYRVSGIKRMILLQFIFIVSYFGRLFLDSTFRDYALANQSFWVLVSTSTSS